MLFVGPLNTLIAKNQEVSGYQMGAYYLDSFLRRRGRLFIQGRRGEGLVLADSRGRLSNFRNS